MDKCPFCGAEFFMSINGVDKMDCNTVMWPNDPERSVNCYERQIANLKERLEAWRELAKSYEPRNYGAMTIAKQKLKDLGEVLF